MIYYRDLQSAQTIEKDKVRTGRPKVGHTTLWGPKISGRRKERGKEEEGKCDKELF